MNLKATIPAEQFITGSRLPQTILIPLIDLLFKKSFSPRNTPGDERFLLRNVDFAQRAFPGTSVKFNLDQNNHHQNLFL